VCLQILQRFEEHTFFDTVLPRLLSSGAPLLPESPPAPPLPAPSVAGVAPPARNITSLKGGMLSAPFSQDVVTATWSASRSNGAPLPPLANTLVTWFHRAHLVRAAPYKRVCKVTVGEGAVLLQYVPRDGGAAERLEHDHRHQPVASARLLRASAFFTAIPKSGDPPRDFCFARAYLPHTVETPRSLEVCSRPFRPPPPFAPPLGRALPNHIFPARSSRCTSRARSRLGTLLFPRQSSRTPCGTFRTTRTRPPCRGRRRKRLSPSATRWLRQTLSWCQR